MSAVAQSRPLEAGAPTVPSGFPSAPSRRAAWAVSLAATLGFTMAGVGFVLSALVLWVGAGICLLSGVAGVLVRVMDYVEEYPLPDGAAIVPEAADSRDPIHSR